MTKPRSMYPGHDEHMYEIRKGLHGLICGECHVSVSPVAPEVGQGMTEALPSDSMPYVVVGVSTSGRTVTLWPLPTDQVMGKDWVAHHLYTDEEIAAGLEQYREAKGALPFEPERVLKVRLHRDGYYHLPAGAGTRMYRSYVAVFHRNYAD